MKRRTFFQRLFAGLGVAVASPVVVAEDRSVLIQESPVAGFQFHRGDAVWPYLAVGALLELVREPNNSHDTNAVAVYFQNDKLGYVPRGENSAVAQMLDRGEQLTATVSRLTVGEDPWQRVRFSVFLA
jgi:ABC-type cobalamin transport system ATPase subunit